MKMVGLKSSNWSEHREVPNFSKTDLYSQICHYIKYFTNKFNVYFVWWKFNLKYEMFDDIWKSLVKQINFSTDYTLISIHRFTAQ